MMRLASSISSRSTMAAYLIRITNRVIFSLFGRMPQVILLRWMIGMACFGLSQLIYAAEPSHIPSRPVRMIVPFPAGGPTDIAARILAQRLTEIWKQQVVVDNRGGGNGIIGQQIAARSAPDGHTILVQSVAFAINPSLYKLPYDTLRDFTPVSQVAATGLVLAVNAGLPVRSVQDLISAARTNSGNLNFASFGQGSIAHLAAELFNVSTGIKTTHVAYKGVPQALTDLIAARVHFMFAGVPSVLPHMGTGKLRPLAVSSRQRSALAPQLPTMIEAGVSDYEATSWFGLFLPAGASPRLAEAIQLEVDRIMRERDIRSQFETQGFDPIANSPRMFSSVIRQEILKYAKVVRAAGVKVE